MTTVPSSPALANPKVRSLIRNMASGLKDLLSETRGHRFRDFEDLLLQVTTEATRQGLEGALQTIANRYGPTVRIVVEGKHYKSHLSGKVVVHSLCGPLEVDRFTFRQVGVHNGPTVVPMNLAAGLVEGATPILAENVVHGYAKSDMRDFRDSLLRSRRAPPSRATLERLAVQYASISCGAPDEVENTIRLAEEIPKEACGISLGFDRTSVAMAEPRPPEKDPRPHKKRTKPRVRRTPAPVDVAFRMAYVATVSIVDRHGEALQTRRYAAPGTDDPRLDLVAGVVADIRAALTQEPNLKIGIVQDGAPEMWNLATAGLERLRGEGVLEDWTETIDRFHLLERLGKAAAMLTQDSEERTAQLENWKAALRSRDSAIDEIQDEMVESSASLQPTFRADLEEHLRYIENNKGRMRYAETSANGLPVGSGATEGAAKTVVGKRAKSGGQRWSEPGLRGVLKLRALKLSERLDPYWAQLSRTYEIPVAFADAA